MELKKIATVERRNKSPEASSLWDELSLAQKFSASSIGKFGYELVCIRMVEGYKIAILECNGGVATITEDGEINTSADITLRVEK